MHTKKSGGPFFDRKSLALSPFIALLVAPVIVHGPILSSSLRCEAGVTCEPSSHARCRVLGRARPSCYLTEGMGMGMGMEMGTARSLDSNCGFGFRAGGSKRFDPLPCVVPAVQAMAMAGISAEKFRQIVLTRPGFLKNLFIGIMAISEEASRFLGWFVVKNSRGKKRVESGVSSKLRGL
jgi:hypothetical protein